jgi:hypothetical protein
MPSLLWIGVGSAPGVTTAVTAVAAMWPDEGRRTIVVEADASGGDLASRCGLPLVPGLVELASDARRASAMQQRDLLSIHAQAAALGGRQVDVVVAPPGLAQVRVALPTLVRSGVLTGTPDTVVHVDAGRVDPHDSAWPLLESADVVVAVVRSRADALAHLDAVVPDLRRAAGERLVVLLSQDGRYPPGEVSDTVDVPVLPVVLPTDPRAVEVLTGALRAGRRWHRLPLFAAASAVSDLLCKRLEPSPAMVAAR